MLPKVLHDLAGREHLLEVVVLSTCNRTEIYARCSRFHAAVGDVRDFLAAHSGAHPDDLADHLYTYFDDAAVAHLFSVAAGLDSMIVGESEILGQVHDAWDAAVREGAASQLLSRLFRHAVESGKRVRTETGHRPAPGVDLVGRGRGRGRTPRFARRRARARHRRRRDGRRRRPFARVARHRRRVRREPHAGARRRRSRGASAAAR